MNKAKHALALGVILLASTVGAQQATEGQEHSAHHPTDAAQAAPQSEGEVRKVDLEQGKVTLRHGPLVNLDMPAMTMVFTAADPKLLEGLKPGEQVRFTAARKDGGYIVTAIEPAK